MRGHRSSESRQRAKSILTDRLAPSRPARVRFSRVTVRRGVQYLLHPDEGHRGRRRRPSSWRRARSLSGASLQGYVARRSEFSSTPMMLMPALIASPFQRGLPSRRTCATSFGSKRRCAPSTFSVSAEADTLATRPRTLAPLGLSHRDRISRRHAPSAVQDRAGGGCAHAPMVPARAISRQFHRGRCDANEHPMRLGWFSLDYVPNCRARTGTPSRRVQYICCQPKAAASP